MRERQRREEMPRKLAIALHCVLYRRVLMVSYIALAEQRQLETAAHHQRHEQRRQNMRFFGVAPVSVFFCPNAIAVPKCLQLSSRVQPGTGSGS